MSMSLGERARSAVLWNTGFSLFRDGLQFLVMLVLVRLLDPEAYGQFALATSIIGFVALLSFSNFIAHALQPRRDAEVDYHLHFTAGAAFQITAFLAANVVALVVRTVPAYAETAPLIHLLSLTFLLEWPCEVRRKMLERALDWRRLRLLHAVGLLASATLAVLMALGGAGVYALVVPGMLVTLPFTYDLFSRVRWRPDWRWDRRRYVPAFRFGLARTTSGLTARLRPLLEQGLIVQTLGYASAGFLTRGLGLAAIFCQRPAMQLMYAIYPVMTRIDPGTERYRRMSTLLLRTVVWTVVPAAALFAILAEPVVELVYGAKWTAVTPLLPWALLAGALGALQHTLYMLLLAHGGARTCLVGDVLTLLGVGLSLALLLPSGLAAYLGGFCAVQSLVALFLVERLRRAGGLDLGGLGLAIGPALVAIVVAVSLTHQGFAVLALDEGTTAGAALFGAVASALYLAVLRLLFPRQLDELLGHLPGVNNAMRRFFMLEPAR